MLFNISYSMSAIFQRIGAAESDFRKR